MPALPVPLPYVKVAVFGNVVGVPTVNVFYYKSAAPPSMFVDGDADLFAAAWEAACVGNWLTCLSPDARLGTTYVECVDSANLFPAAGVIAQDGTGSGDTLPAQDQAVIRWIVPAVGVGRKAPGRTNIAGMPEATVDNMTIGTAQMGALDALAQSLNGTITVGGIAWDLAVYSPTQGVLQVTQGYFVNPEIKVLRRRRNIS